MTAQNMEAVWVKILRALRTEKNFALFGLLSNMDDVEFTKALTRCIKNYANEKNMLKNHLPTLQKLAGGLAQVTLQDHSVVTHDDNAEYITRLKDLFGDKVEIV